VWCYVRCCDVAMLVLTLALCGGVADVVVAGVMVAVDVAAAAVAVAVVVCC